MITALYDEQVNYKLSTSSSFRWNWNAIKTVHVFIDLKQTNTWTQDTVLNENLSVCWFRIIV